MSSQLVANSCLSVSVQHYGHITYKVLPCIETIFLELLTSRLFCSNDALQHFFNHSSHFLLIRTLSCEQKSCYFESLIILFLFGTILVGCSFVYGMIWHDMAVYIICISQQCVLRHLLKAFWIKQLPALQVRKPSLLDAKTYLIRKLTSNRRQSAHSLNSNMTEAEVSVKKVELIRNLFEFF